jgi:molybdopterin/thiamine biosynthesis adenylyltransferase
MALSPDDLERHSRHILVKEIGGAGVQKLRAASVSIIGAGALGGPCALYLAAAGLGRLEIWDDDGVERSNLQRQVQFGEADIGAPKAERLAERLRSLNPGIEIKAMTERFGPGSAPDGEILIDASDNFPARQLLNRLAHTTGRPLISGAAAGWIAHIGVFASGIDRNAPCYECWMSEAPGDIAGCDAIGVVGAITGMAGACMAMEAVKLVTEAGEPLIGRVLVLDGLSQAPRVLKLRPDPACQVCGTGRGEE